MLGKVDQEASGSNSSGVEAEEEAGARLEMRWLMMGRSAGRKGIIIADDVELVVVVLSWRDGGGGGS